MHHFTKFLLLPGIILAICVSSSWANDPSKDKEIAERFAKCDTNHDGRLTKEEAKGCMPRIYSHFSFLDTDNKGYLTVAQIQAVVNR